MSSPSPLPAPRSSTSTEIAEWIKYHHKNHQHGVTFLVGAGFSASAGIPTAGQMVKTLRAHPLLRNAGAVPPEKSEYAFLMGKLPPDERVEVIRNAIRQAEDPNTKRLKINWAHLLLATLVDAGYVSGH